MLLLRHGRTYIKNRKSSVRVMLGLQLFIMTTDVANAFVFF